MLTRRTQVAIKEEQTEGTAETLTNSEAIDAMNVTWSPNIEVTDRNPVRSSLSPISGVPGLRRAMVSFEMEIKGAGAGLTCPFAEPLKACGVAETLVASTSATYLPASTSIPSVTIGVYRDGKRYLFAGCRGNATFIFEAGKPGRIRFDFTAADFTESDTALLSSVSYSSVIPPAFQGVSYTLDSYAGTITQLEIAFNNTIALRPDVNASSGHLSAVITGRRPTLTLDPEDVLAATEDYLGNWRSGSTMALTTGAIGSGAGYILTLTAPAVQFLDCQPGDRDGLSSWEISALLAASSGDDEWQLQVT